MYCQSMETEITADTLSKAVERVHAAKKHAEVVVLIPTVELNAVLEENIRLRAFEARMRELSRQEAPIWLSASGESGWQAVTDHIADELGEQ